jgi:iron(III) transport system substrate-binding protein
MLSKRGRRALTVVAAFAASAVLLAGCSSSAPAAKPRNTSDPLAGLAAKANSEGALTIYASAADSQLQTLSKAFMEAYPDIKVDYFRAAGTALFNRFSTEAQSGSTAADVFMPTIQPSFVEDNAKWFDKLTDKLVPNAKDIPADFRTDYTLQVAVEEVVPIYNTDTVKTPPKKWSDVLNSKYKGRIILVDPKSSPGYMSWYEIMRKKFGDSFLTKLAALDPVWVDTGAVGAQKVATGSYDITLPTYPSHAVGLIDQGAPLKFVRNLDPTQGITTSIAITKGAPHPSAAQLFTNWLVSPDGFKAVCSDPVYSATIPGTTCQKLATHFVQPDWEISQADQNKIVSLLGR